MSFVTATPPATYDVVSIFEILSHLLQLDVKATEPLPQQTRNGSRKIQRAPVIKNDPINKELLTGLALLASLVMSGDEEMKKNATRALDSRYVSRYVISI